MNYISQSPINCSKGNIQCVLKCTTLPEKQPMVIFSRRTAHQLNTDIRNTVIDLTKKMYKISTHALCLTTNY